MAQTRKSGPKAGDATGRRKAALEAEQQATAAKRQEELTMINAQAAAEAETGVFDPTTNTMIGSDEASEEDAERDPSQPEEVPAGRVLDFGVQTVEGDDEVVIRVNETLTNVTIGRGTFYNFDEGKQYKVSRNVAAHLEEKGYLWH